MPRSFVRPVLGDLCAIQEASVRCQSPQGDAALSPRLGERQSLSRARRRIRPSSAETGEGSSRHPASGYAKPSPRRPLQNAPPPRRRVGSCSLSWEPPTVWEVKFFRVALLLTLSWGRGRFGRLRPKPVRGLPGTQSRVTQKPPLSGPECVFIVNPGTPAACRSRHRQRPRR